MRCLVMALGMRIRLICGGVDLAAITQFFDCKIGFFGIGVFNEYSVSVIECLPVELNWYGLGICTYIDVVLV